MAGKDMYNRLMRSRSKQTFKDFNTKSTPSPSSKTINQPPPTGSALKSDSMLSLPISMTGDDTASLVDDEGISRFLSTRKGDTRDRPKGGASRQFAETQTTNNDGLETPRSGSPRQTVAGFRSPNSMANASIDGSYPMRRSAESVVEDLRENVLREMKEKEALLTKYEALSKQHIHLEDLLAKKNAEIPKKEDLSQHADHKQLLLKFEALSMEHREIRDQLAKKDEEMAKKEEEIRTTAVTNHNEAQESTRDSKHVEEQITNAHTLIRHHEEESDRLRKQNLQLREGTTVSPQVNGVTNDSDLKVEMGNLNAEVQNWILVNYRKFKLDLSNLDEETERAVDVAVPRWKAVAGIAKIAFLQALASTHLVEVFYDEFFIGLPEIGKYNTPTAAFAQWRAATVTFLSRSDDAEITKSTNTLATYLSKGIDRLLCKVTEAELSDSRQQSLQRIAIRAIKLARFFRSQAAEYEFNIPRSSADRALAFDSFTMEDIRAEEGDSNKKTVQLATFPAVMKTKDEQGRREGVTNVVIKAKVLTGAKIGTG